MADVEPLHALHYDPSHAGPLQDLIAPPYDVLDAQARAALAARSPYNVVHIDLPEGSEPYRRAAELLARWRDEGAIVRDQQPALWALTQDYTAPGGGRHRRHGILARVRVEDYGPGRIRPHERTHAGPKEDRLRLTRATAVNLSPIFSLYSDRSGAAWSTVARALGDASWGEATDADGTVNRVYRIGDPEAIAAVREALEDAELLIADGHHRYETARAYAEEVGGEGPHRYVLMCLVALEDPGLTVLPTHRLVRGLTSEQQESLADAIRRDFEIEEVAGDELEPRGNGRVRIGYMDSHFRRAFRLTLRTQAAADAALAGKPEPYRRLDTAVVEALLLKGALGMTDEDIDRLDGLGYAKDTAEARALVESREYDAAFFMRATPVGQVQEVAATGETMPPKSTYFFPKIPTGLLFNPLTDA